MMGVWVSAIPASTCVETFFPKCTGWEEKAPVHTCQKEAYRSPWAHSPHKRNAPRDVQSEVAVIQRQIWEKNIFRLCFRPTGSFAKGTANRVCRFWHLILLLLSQNLLTSSKRDDKMRVRHLWRHNELWMNTELKTTGSCACSWSYRCTSWHHF